VDLARVAGLNLDPWQEMVLRQALGRRADGKWSAFEVGLVVPRQNGKGAILEALELAALYLLGHRTIIHSAHEFATSAEHFRRITDLIEGTPDLSKRVKKNGIKRSHGEEGVELTNGHRLRFKTRTKAGGRGFSCDLLVLDEAMILPVSAHGAMFPTVSARPNAQVWYTGSSVDQEVHEHGLVLARVRERGIAGGKRLAYFEWSAEGDLETVDPTSLDARADGNPGLGIRITHEHVELEQQSMDPRTFAVERLGVGDWPSLDADDRGGITPAVWNGLIDLNLRLNDPVCLAVDVKPDRSAACISAAGKFTDSLHGVEVVDHRKGTGWVVPRLLELRQRQRPAAIILDGAGPAASLIADLERERVDVVVVNAKEHAQACGRFYDACDQGTLRHLGTSELFAAIRGAAIRPLGDAWAWSRKSSNVDISPLVSATLALWGTGTQQRAAAPRLINLAEV
jgi:hypothetical protein